jgi:thymidylate kinase
METLEIQQKVRNVYLKFVKKGDLIRVDGDKPKEVVSDELYTMVLGLLKACKSPVS